MPRQLDLRTGRPVWSAYRAPKVPVSRLARDVKADVVIVGMGISGAMMAETLTAAGRSVVVVDRRGPLLGSTMATTALVQFEIDQPLTLLSKKIGKASAERAWRRSRLAVFNLAARIDELGIRCDCAWKQSLYLAGTTLVAGALRDEAEARRLAGIHAAYLTAGELRDRFGMARDGAILSHGNIALDPRKLTAGLLLKALARKARLYAPVEAVSFTESRDGVTVATSEGPTISAGFLILATGYELMDKVPTAGHSIISTFAIATAPQKRFDWKNLPLVWEASDPYLYLRASADGRIICGGEDEDFTDTDRRDALIAQKTAAIAARLKKLLPSIDATPQFAWAGSFGSSGTGLPLIGRVPRHTRTFAVMGYGGNGITYSQIASEIVSAAIAGHKDADAGLYALDG
ncbi:Glycine/D-amino acid oxidase [Mesorhizobium albiziae]|uniref:Glycine/D-amino acid oxidase n=1 Tax=Neomesorhizobium albiziae TaxID=335020 RepID=A0A1I4A809_9HYPH|nr:FAD-binding oxidoreductase [Mesorhizobium albiziae]GLS34088.1 FAD-dependent oxidoreductase [Mesorhizobium albiziae]SFK52310.1 Glycine/D-amino acid oxidase [Mesorhizobium albiziae]